LQGVSTSSKNRIYLTLYQEITREEIDTLDHHKQNILTLMKSGELLSPEEEQKQLQAYLTKALLEMKKESLKKE
jgi:gluconate kinase